MDLASTTSLAATPSSSSDLALVTNSSARTVSLSPSPQSSTILTSSTTPLSTSSTSPSSTIPPTSTTPPSTAPSTTSTPVQITSILTVITSGSQVTTIVTSTLPFSSSSQTSEAASSSTTGVDPTLQGSNSTSTSTGLSQAGKTAIEVIVPIIGVALIVLALVFFWRKRKQRKDAEELRKKEVEEYGYNPNDDPTLPAVGGVKSATGDGPFEMHEDGGGYRGWGATTAGSSGRKASTGVSGGPIGMAYSDSQSPTHGPVSDSRSGDTLIGSPTGRPTSDGLEILGAMGPAASANRAGDMHRGPSNASSSYSAANRSDGSEDQPIPGGAYGQAQYYSGEGTYGGPYADTPYGAPAGRAEMGGQPVIRDNLARRATRIENPSHFPTQASAGISQNF
jgi:hypothetical protein